MKDATTNTITPRDEQEAKTLSVGARIATAIGIVGTAVSALLAAFGGLDWITAHLPLLLTGLGSLASGGIASYIAIRRMSIDKIAKGTGLIIIAVGLSGCVAICADSTGEGASVMAFGWGADSAAALSNVAVTGPSTNDSTGVSFDTANSQQKSAQAIQSLISLGAALAPVHRGRDGALSCAAPPSEPYRRISRIRLSSRWCYRSHGLAAYAQAATQENSPCSVKQAFGQRMWSSPRPRPFLRHRLRRMLRRRMRTHPSTSSKTVG